MHRSQPAYRCHRVFDHIYALGKYRYGPASLYPMHVSRTVVRVCVRERDHPVPCFVCRAGYIFPMLMSVREQPASDGPPGFLGILRVLNTVENHILLNSDFAVTAASQASMVLFNLEASALTNSECKIVDFVSEWNVSTVRVHARPVLPFSAASGSALSALTLGHMNVVTMQQHAALTTCRLTPRVHQRFCLLPLFST